MRCRGAPQRLPAGRRLPPTGVLRRLFFGGEETLLAQDLAAAGWGLAYVDDVLAHHHPQSSTVRAGRHRLLARNTLVSSLLPRPLPVSLRQAAELLRDWRQTDVRAGLADAARLLPTALAQRRRLPPEVEEQVRLLGATRR